jgi:MFS family permease
MQRTLIPEEFRRHGIVLIAATVGVMLALSTLGVSFVLNLFVEPLEAAFGWSRQQILTVPLILALCLVPSGIAIGWIADRYGVRKPILFSQVALGLGFIALGLLTHTLTEFYLLYAVMALLAAGTLPITFSKLLTSRFVRHRGLAIGIAQSGTGICAVIAPAYINWFMGHGGWRVAYVAVGCLPLLIALPLGFRVFPREVPAARGEPAARAAPAAPAAATATPGAPGAPGAIRAAVGNYRFWVMGLAFFLVSAGASGILANFSPLLVSRHYSRDAAAALQGAFGGIVILGRVLVGLLFDRLWAPVVGTCFLLPAGIAAWVLHSTTGGPLDALPLIFIALATGAEVDLCAYLTSRYFRLEDYGRIYGVEFLCLAMGGGLSSPFYGHLYDMTKSYGTILTLVSASFTASALLLLTLGRYPRLASPRTAPH